MSNIYRQWSFTEWYSIELDCSGYVYIQLNSQQQQTEYVHNLLDASYFSKAYMQ